MGWADTLVLLIYAMMGFIVGSVGLYIIARLVTVAILKSVDNYEREKQYEKRQRQRFQEREEKQEARAIKQPSGPDGRSAS